MLTLTRPYAAAVPFRELKHIVLRDPRAHGDIARADDPESVEAALQAVVESGGASDAQNRERSWAAGESTPQSAAAASPFPSDDDPCVGPRGLLAASPPSPAPAAAAATTAAASRDLGPVVQAQSEAAGWVGVAEEPESDATATPSTQASADRRCVMRRLASPRYRGCTAA